MEALGIVMIVAVAVGWLWITRDEQQPAPEEGTDHD